MYVQAIQNLGLGVVTLLAGMIVDKHGYLWLEMFFMMWLVVGLVCIFAIYIIDCKGTHFLNMGIKAREEYTEKLNAEKAQEEARAKAKEQRERDPVRPRTGSELRNRCIIHFFIYFGATFGRFCSNF